MSTFYKGKYKIKNYLQKYKVLTVSLCGAMGISSPFFIQNMKIFKGFSLQLQSYFMIH